MGAISDLVSDYCFAFGCDLRRLVSTRSWTTECNAVRVRTLCGSVRYTRMDATKIHPREKVKGAAGSQDRLIHIGDMRYARGTLTSWINPGYGRSRRRIGGVGW